MTKIINLFAGPGAGKSTTAAGIFHLLKTAGRNCELVHEFAKDLTWRERQNTLRIQPYVFGKQLERIESLIDKVDFIITDSPILLSAIYVEGSKYPKSFTRSVIDIFNLFDNHNYFLWRSKEYLQIGRSQTLAQSQLLDHRIRELLVVEQIAYFPLVGNSDAPQAIVKHMGL